MQVGDNQQLGLGAFDSLLNASSTALLRNGDRSVDSSMGALFSCTGGLRHCMRLSFAHYPAAEIGEGVARLGALLNAGSDPQKVRSS